MRHKILFVDDEDNILQAIKRKLNNLNYELLFAHNGNEGLKILENHEPSIIISDLKMPGMNGIEFLKRAKNIFPNSIRIILSGLSDKDNVINAYRSGEIWKYIIKPWNDNDLYKLLENAAKIYEDNKNNLNNKNNFVDNKKIFFLYPHPIIIEKVILDLVRNGYEVYYLKDYIKAKKIFQLYNDSIVFINIDAVMNESEWSNYIIEIMKDDSTKNIKIGILTYYENPEIKKKYLMEVMVHCGFIQLKSGVDQCKRLITRVLEANEVKGTRSYLRIRCNEKSKASLNIKVKNKMYKGIILDISLMAIACKIEGASFLEVDQTIEGIQLNLRGKLLLITGTIKMIKNINDENVYVIFFKQPLSDKICEGIYLFFHYSLQQFIDELNNKITL